MFCRITTVLSAVVVAVLATILQPAVFPTLARAAAECLATPGGIAPDGGRWKYRIDRANGRKCWFVAGGRPTVRNATQESSPWSQFTELVNPKIAEPAPPARNCIAAPTSRSTQGTRWHYRLDTNTGQRCWFLKGGTSTSAGAINARSSRRAKATAPELRALSKAAANANAQARLMDSQAAPVPPIKPALPEAIAVEQGIREKPKPSTFESRWNDLRIAKTADSGPEIASSSFETSANKPEINQPDPPASELVTTSAKGSGDFFPLDVTLFVIVMSMGGALILLACLAPSILYMRDKPNRSTGIHGLPDMRIMTVSGLGPPLTPAPPFFGGERRAMDRSAEGRR